MTTMLNQYKDLPDPYETMYDNFCDALDQANEALTNTSDACEEFAAIATIRNNIRTFGVTQAIFDDHHEMLWDKYEFDLTPFLNAGNESLTYCLEGLTKVMSDILNKIKLWLIRIAEWFATETIFKRYSSVMYFYTIRAHELHAAWQSKMAYVDVGKYKEVVCSGYDKTNYMNLCKYIGKCLNYLCTGVGALTNISAVETLFKQINESIAPIGYDLLNDGSVTQRFEINTRYDSMRNLEWDRDSVFTTAYITLEGTILKKTIDATKLRYNIRRTVIDWDRKINAMLSADSVNEKDVEEARAVKNGCLAIRIVLDLAMRKSGALAKQWCTMCNKFQEAIVTTVH